MPVWAEYARYVGRRWWFVVVGVVGGVLTVVALVASIVIPTWLGIVILVVGLSVAQFLAFKDMRGERDKALEASRVTIGPSPFPRSKLERAVVTSMGAFEKLEREMTVQGEVGLFDRLMECAGKVDLELRKADAGALYDRFREDGLYPPHDVDEQRAYIQRQIVLFRGALRDLRRDEVEGVLGPRG
jgi:hypothetical protein